MKLYVGNVVLAQGDKIWSHVTITLAASEAEAKGLTVSNAESVKPGWSILFTQVTAVSEKDIADAFNDLQKVEA